MALYEETTTFHGSGRREDLNRPHSCCWNNGSLFVTDTLNNRIVQIWDIPRLADKEKHDPRAGQTPKNMAETNGRMYRTVATSTTWMFPLGMISIPCYFKPERPGDQQRQGSLLVVCDSGHNRIKLVFVPNLAAYKDLRHSLDDVDPSKLKEDCPSHVITLAGNGKRGLQNGIATKATFNRPSGVCIASDGSLIIADTGNHCIRRISLRKPPPPKVFKSPIRRHRGGGEMHNGGESTSKRKAPNSTQKYNKLIHEFENSEKHGIRGYEGVVGALASWAATGSLNCLPAGMELVVSTIAGGGTVEDRKRAALQQTAISMTESGASVESVAELIVEAAKDVPEVNMDKIKLPVTTSGYRDGVGKTALFNNPVDILLDRHGRIMVADQNNDCLRMMVKTSTKEWKVTTLKEHKEETSNNDESGALAIVEKEEVQVGNNDTNGMLILPPSKWRPAHFNRPNSLCHVDGRNLQEGMMLVSHKHAISLVCFDFFSEAQDSNSANRISHFVLAGKKDLKKDTDKFSSNNDLAPSHGYLDSENVDASRFWNPRGLCIKPGMDVMVADASNCVIRQLSRGHITLAKAVQQVRTPGVAKKTGLQSSRGGSISSNSRRRRSTKTRGQLLKPPSYKRSNNNRNNSIINRNIKNIQQQRRKSSRKSQVAVTAANKRGGVRKAKNAALTPRGKSKQSANDGMGRTIGSILRQSFTSGASPTRGYLEDVKQILAAPPSRKNISTLSTTNNNNMDMSASGISSPSSINSTKDRRRSSTNSSNTKRRTSMTLLDRAWTRGKSSTKMFIDDIQDAVTPHKNDGLIEEQMQQQQRPATAPVNTNSKVVNSNFEKALRTSVHERDVIERKRERRQSVTEAQKTKPKINQAQHGSDVRTTRRVTELSGKKVKQSSVRKFKRRPSSPHLSKTTVEDKKKGKLNRFAGLRELRRSKREIMEAKLTRERHRQWTLKKQATQPKKILRKGGGRLSVSAHRASEMAVHEFHPSFSRRSTAVSDVIRYKE